MTAKTVRSAQPPTDGRAAAAPASPVPAPSLATRPPDDDPMPEPPREPALEECCGSGCDPCVFDRYDLERHAYREALKAWKLRHPDVKDAASAP